MAGQRTSNDSVESAVYAAAQRNNYPYLARVTSNFRQRRKSAFMDDVESMAHLMVDTAIKLSANGAGSVQTNEYLEMLRGNIDALQEKHFNGRLTPGDHGRMIGGEWTDES